MDANDILIQTRLPVHAFPLVSISCVSITQLILIRIYEASPHIIFQRGISRIYVLLLLLRKSRKSENIHEAKFALRRVDAPKSKNTCDCI